MVTILLCLTVTRRLAFVGWVERSDTHRWWVAFLNGPAAFIAWCGERVPSPPGGGVGRGPLGRVKVPPFIKGGEGDWVFGLS